jgi:hypothetical protein
VARKAVVTRAAQEGGAVLPRRTRAGLRLADRTGCGEEDRGEENDGQKGGKDRQDRGGQDSGE